MSIFCSWPCRALPHNDCKIQHPVDMEVDVNVDIKTKGQNNANKGKVSQTQKWLYYILIDPLQKTKWFDTNNRMSCYFTWYFEKKCNLNLSLVVDEIKQLSVSTNWYSVSLEVLISVWVKRPPWKSLSESYAILASIMWYCLLVLSNKAASQKVISHCKLAWALHKPLLPFLFLVTNIRRIYGVQAMWLYTVLL